MTNALSLSIAPAFALPALGPTRDASGVAIDVEVSTDAALYSVILINAAGQAARRIAMTTDERAARRVWSLLARSLQVPRFIANVGGGFRALDIVMGPVVARPPVDRRSRRARRRPSSRRTKPMAGVSSVHAGEREIICYE